MYRWPHDSEAALIAYFGHPGPEVERQLVHVVPPFQMYYPDDKRGLIPLKSLLFHRKAADALLAALNDVWERCGKDQKKIDALGISKTAGTYCCRKIAGSDRWSNHAFGGAIDINSQDNGFNKGHGNIPQVLIDAFDRVGFRWGGRYHHRTDPMHFEACDDGSTPAHPAGLLDMTPNAEGVFEAWSGETHKDGCCFLDAPAADQIPDDHDEPEVESHGSGKGFFGRVRNWVVTAGTSLGFSGLGAITDWQVAIVCFSFALILIVGVVGFVLWLFGKNSVRDWAIRELT